MKLSELYEVKSSGKSTAKLGTTRASKNDILIALTFVSKNTGISIQDLKDNLLGSSAKTLSGITPDSGDVDIAIEDARIDRDDVIKKLLQATKQKSVHRTGDGLYSFAIPVSSNRSVQVDLIFTKSTKWTKWTYHSADSKYKAAVRSLLLVNIMKQIYEPGKDLEIKEDGETIIRVRRSFKADVGLERLFKLRKMLKNGKRSSSLVKVSPEEIQAELQRIGKTDKFSSEKDIITDPDRAATLMFGIGIKNNDTKSVEQIINIIKTRKDADIIFKNTMNDLKDSGLKVPPELEKFR